ncbi:MAG: hypothetical protein AAGG02_12560 [Cyanobacteria bacterium P01_H01_bin.15]
MNTPSHLLLNLAALGSLSPQAKVAIAIGAVLPDVPIFAFYFVMKGVYRLPESEIWSQAYYEPLIQDIVALFHSLPIACLGLAIAWGLRSQVGMWFCASLIGHSLLDLPVHNDDAHRHFYPLSNFRFISPLSYWDPRHFGRWVALGEILAVVGVTPQVFRLVPNVWLRSIIVLMESFAIATYGFFYWRA